MDGNIELDIYTTDQGDTWDIISFKVFGEEKYMHKLIAANTWISHMVIFPANVDIIIPDIEEDEDESLPPWKRGVLDES